MRIFRDCLGGTPASTANRVKRNLVPQLTPLEGRFLLSNIDLEPNDTVKQAVNTGLTVKSPGTFVGTGVILNQEFKQNDVDIYVLKVAGQGKGKINVSLTSGTNIGFNVMLFSDVPTTPRVWHGVGRITLPEMTNGSNTLGGTLTNTYYVEVFTDTAVGPGAFGSWGYSLSISTDPQLSLKPDINIKSAQAVVDKISYDFSATNLTGSFSLALFQSADKNFDPGIDVPVGSAQAISQTSPKPGSISLPSTFRFDATKPYLLVVADPSNTVKESNELNNWAWVEVSPPVSAQLIAYRPALPNNPHIDAKYQINFHNYPISATESHQRGVGIRIDAQDNGPTHAVQTGKPDLDLLEVDMRLNSLAPKGTHYVLQRSNPNLRVWNDQSKTRSILNTDSVTLIPSSLNQPLWVEWSGANGGTGSLNLFVVNETTGTKTLLNYLVFRTFTSEAIIFTGETFFESNAGVSYGAMGDVFNTLYGSGYDVHIFVPLDTFSSSIGVLPLAYSEVVDAVNRRGITNFSIVGYSHGGGAAYKMAVNISLGLSLSRSVVIPYTAYIDAVDDTTPASRTPVSKLPPGSRFHVNIFQTIGEGLANSHGQFIKGSNISIDKTPLLNHRTIAADASVQKVVEDNFFAKVSR